MSWSPEANIIAAILGHTVLSLAGLVLLVLSIFEALA